MKTIGFRVVHDIFRHTHLYLKYFELVDAVRTCMWYPTADAWRPFFPLVLLRSLSHHLAFEQDGSRYVELWWLGTGWMAQWQRDWGALSSSSTAKRARKALDPNLRGEYGQEIQGNIGTWYNCCVTDASWYLSWYLQFLLRCPMAENPGGTIPTWWDLD